MANRVAVVTGSSRGIGAEIAKKLAQAGNDIVINYFSNIEQAEKVVAECQSFGVMAVAFKADVSKFDEAKALIDFAVTTFSRIDILVNNAGRAQDNLLLRMTEEQFDGVIAANLKSAFNMIKLAAPVMTKARFGRIINMSSIAGLYGNAGQVNYSAAKAGLIGLTKATAKELGGRNITSNAVAPGFIETDMTANLPEKVMEYAVTASSLKRIGKPNEVAALVAFIASDDAAFITGQVIAIDGGLTL